MVDPRKEKRFFRKNGQDDPVYYAWIAGQFAAEIGKPKRNPYPPGRRHDEFERGYREESEDNPHVGRRS